MKTLSDILSEFRTKVGLGLRNKPKEFDPGTITEQDKTTGELRDRPGKFRFDNELHDKVVSAVDFAMKHVLTNIVPKFRKDGNSRTVSGKDFEV